MFSLARTGRTAAVGLTLAGLASGCAVSAASTPATGAAAAAGAAPAAAANPATTPPTTVAASRAGAAAPAIDHLTAVARRRYAVEVHGGVAIGTAHRVARDPTLLRTLQSGNVAATRAYVRREFPAVWYHWHVSRMRIRKGSKVVAETGVPFVVAPSQVTLRSSGGRTLGTLEVSVQDEIGFVRFMHRNYPVDVVVRGKGAAHVRTSLPAATHANLPSRGPVTIAGRPYLVRSFHETAWNGEPVTVWILTKA
ncbi:MAG: hypothetical protein QOH46_548 [Solirubrobacteraceae bacterium]|jgi:hypothetical protein|nr:hypothetical protein [Solirubrobacteraceae bacterium]